MNKVDYLDMPVAYAMDQPSFFNELTIYENLLLIASSRKIKKQEAFDKIERILDGRKNIYLASEEDRKKHGTDVVCCVDFILGFFNGGNGLKTVYCGYAL